MMRRVFLSVLLFAFATAGLQASKVEPTESEVQEIIEKFAVKEAEFARAREAYTYRQTVRVQELDETNTPRGKFEMVSDIIFSQDGKRTERVVFAPVTTLRNILITPEDEQDLRNVQPFVLTSQDIDKYHVHYLGKQMADEIPAYVFAVKPKKMEQGQRYFQGMIWVDDESLQIVKSYGRGVGLIKKGSDNQFPKFETYRQMVDGQYWFPVYTRADDTLHFQSGPQKIRMLVRYDDYKQFKADTTIKFGEPVDQAAPEQTPKP
jgi:outer membrane lipoprotein-sorting protein